MYICNLSHIIINHFIQKLLKNQKSLNLHKQAGLISIEEEKKLTVCLIDYTKIIIQNFPTEESLCHYRRNPITCITCYELFLKWTLINKQTSVLLKKKSV